MVKKTTREIYKKSEYPNKEDVQGEAELRLADGAVSAEVISEGDNWVLVIVDEVFAEG